jgi:uncharacterized membrane protein YfcA
LFFAVFAIILMGGIIKGAIGIGLPAFSMSILPLFIDPALAVTLLTIPIIVTNAQQFFGAKDWPAIARKFAIAGTSVFFTITFVSLFLADVPGRFIGLIVGVSLILFVVSSLMEMKLPVTMAPKWQVVAGCLAGITGGLSAVKTPIMIYCAALNLPRDTFVAAAGFLFLMGGLGMLVGQTSASIMNAQTLVPSLIALATAMIGFQIGAHLRKGINAALFRKLLLGAMFILGLRQVFVNLF